MNQLFYNIFNPMGSFFSRDLFADVMSVQNRNMKHTRAIQFDETDNIKRQMIKNYMESVLLKLKFQCEIKISL